MLNKILFYCMYDSERSGLIYFITLSRAEIGSIFSIVGQG